MQEIYQKLNFYLNEICKYLEKNDSFLLEKMNKIARLNDSFLDLMKKYSLENKTIQNRLTYEEVYFLARDIIEQMDKSYLLSFDVLIQSGELDFGYNQEYEDSQCVRIEEKGQLTKLINIARNFNYDDVIALIHEFIHYTNWDKKTQNRYYLTEFLSIYFETYALFYLLERGIPLDEINYFDRMKNTICSSRSLYRYEYVLLAYVKFGALDDNSVTWLQKYFCDIKEKSFQKECKDLYQRLSNEEEYYQEELKENPKSLGKILSRAFIARNYRYVLGTFLAIYARYYADFHDIVYVNNHIHEFLDESVFDICLSIGIDLSDNNFPKKMLDAITQYMNELQKENLTTKKVKKF